MGAAETTQKQDQAAACLEHYFAQRVADAMPAAFNHALGRASVLACWLNRACAHSVSANLGRLSGNDADVLMVGSFSPPTLLVLLMDRRQPEAIIIAARNALLAHFLADAQVSATIKADAEGMARRAVAHLAQQQALERAEAQSLYGHEQSVPGVVPDRRAAQTGRARLAFATLLVSLGSAAALVLAACGGGGCNPCEPDVPTPKVDCKARPELCK